MTAMEYDSRTVTIGQFETLTRVKSVPTSDRFLLRRRRSTESPLGNVENRELTADYHEAATEQVRDELKERGL